jgi:hypothetical protein
MAPENLAAGSPGHAVENLFENAEGVVNESAPLLPESEGEEIQRVQSWSQKSLGQGFIWIQTGKYSLSARSPTTETPSENKY